MSSNVLMKNKRAPLGLIAILALVAAGFGIKSMLASHAASDFEVATSLNMHRFAPDSVWNTRVDGPNEQVDPTSAERMNGLLTALNSRIITNQPASGLGVENSIYVVDSSTMPKTPMYLSDPSPPYKQLFRQLLLAGVPVPPEAQPGPGSDHHMSVYDKKTDTLYDLWRACPPNIDPALETAPPRTCPFASTPPTPTGQWQVSWGGVMQHMSTDPGYFRNICKSASGQTLINTSGCAANTQTEQYNWGAPATSLPVVAGTITVDDFKSGHIDHAINMQLPSKPPSGFDTGCNASLKTGATPFVWPAQRSDGLSNRSDCVPEGAHLRIDPSLDLTTLKLPKVARMVAEAAQKYGIIVNDRTQIGVAFYAENPQAYKLRGDPTNPYTGLPWGQTGTPTPDSIYGGVPNYAQFNGQSYGGVQYDAFPWDRMQILKMNVCHQVPCELSNTTALPAPANQPPTIKLTSPNVQQTLTPGAAATLTASASDVGGSVSKVDFYDGSTLIGTSTSAPYSLTIPAVAGGLHFFSAKATDNAGATATSLVAIVRSVATSGTCAKAASGDTNCDGLINITDLSVLLSHFSQAGSAADFNHDGTVNILDLSILLSHFGK
jgi:hypothetical protein